METFWQICIQIVMADESGRRNCDRFIHAEFVYFLPLPWVFCGLFSWCACGYVGRFVGCLLAARFIFH